MKKICSAFNQFTIEIDRAITSKVLVGIQERDGWIGAKKATWEVTMQIKNNSYP